MAQTTLTFSDGGNAVLRDPREVPVKVRRVWEHASAPMASVLFDLQNRYTDEEEIKRQFALEASKTPELMDAQKDASVLALVLSWSYGEVNQENLENLPVGTYDQLAETCQNLAKEMSPNWKPEVDPKADDSSGAVTLPVSDESANVGQPTLSTPSITTPQTSL